MTEPTLRPIEDTEFPAYIRSAIETFNEDPTDDFVEIERVTFEPKRSLAAFDGARIVATGGIYSRTMTVPGGELPIAGVTLITVSPTHRRRGLLTAMMRRQLTELHDLGQEPVAALWASEGMIYGRFGYGHAARRGRLRGRTRSMWLRPDVPVGDGRIRLVGEEEARPHLARIHDAARHATPGWLDRRDRWWDARLFDSEKSRDGATSYRFALHEAGSGEVDAYAIYRTKHEWNDDLPNSPVLVHELVALDPSAYAAIWQFVLDLDLVHVVDHGFVSPDEPLQYMLTDAEAAKITIRDGLWVRVADVDRGLAARRYATEVDAVFEVEDPFCPWNTGRWRLSGGPDGAVCARTDDPADLRVAPEVLGSIYLGGTTLETLAAAGRVEERRPGAVRAVSRAFRSDVTPYCPEVF